MGRAAVLPALVAFATAASAAAAPTVPQRIVSMNPCADAILREIARPEQIAGVSRLSQDDRTASVPTEWARRFPGVGARAEELLAMRAGLVVSGPGVPPETARMVQRLGIPLVSLPVPASVSDSRVQIMALADRIGEPARGAALVARIDAAIAAARPLHPGQPPVSALIRQPGGMVPGSHTLADDLLTIAGFRNSASRFGLANWDILPLERLAAQPPAVLFTADGRPGHAVLAGRVRAHPFPMRYLWCGGPTIITAIAALAAANPMPESR